MDSGEILYEVGEPGRGVLSAGMVVSISPGEPGIWHLEVALDTTRPAKTVALAPDDGGVTHHDLKPTATRQGDINYLELDVPLRGQGIIIDIQDENKASIGYCIYVKLGTPGVNLLERIPPGSRAVPACWGGRGAAVLSRAANLVGAYRGNVGLALDVCIDYPGNIARVMAMCRPSERMVQSWVDSKPVPGFGRLSFARLWLPPDTTEGKLNFYMGSGEPDESLTWEFSEETFPTAIPLAKVAVAAPVSPRSTPSLPPRPRTSPTNPGGTAPATPSKPATPAAAPPKTPGAKAPAAPALSIAKPQAAAEEPQHWPAELGANHDALGPVCSLTGTQVLTLLSVTPRDGGTDLEIFMDDLGLASRLWFAEDGKVIKDLHLERLTTHSPVHLSVSLPPTGPGLVLYCTNSYGEVYPNLTSAVVLSKGAFRTFNPERETWGKLLRFCAPLNLENSACTICRRDVMILEGVPLVVLSTEEREMLRANYAVSPEARALCKPCHEEHILAHKLRYRLTRWLSGAGLKDSFQRLIFCYSGALLLFTPFGQLVSRMLGIATVSLDISHDLLTMFILAYLLALPPWPLFLDACAHSIKATVRRRQLVGIAGVTVPAFLLALWSFAYYTWTPTPDFYSAILWRFHLHLLCILALIASQATAGMVARLSALYLEQQLRSVKKDVLIASAARMLPQFLQVRSARDFDRAVDRVMLAGFGAVEFQVFTLQPDSQKFRLKRAVGAVRHQLSGLEFNEGDRSIFGQVAGTGRHITELDVNTEKGIHLTVTKSPIPSLAAIPVCRGGKVVEVYNISRLRNPGALRDLANLMELFSISAEKGLALADHATAAKEKFAWS